MTDHIGENAALYALGLLDERAGAEVTEHAATCEPCARLLAQAEDDVTAMAAAQRQFEAPPELAERIARSARNATPLRRVDRRS